jgi:hypothetical protein
MSCSTDDLKILFEEINKIFDEPFLEYNRKNIEILDNLKKSEEHTQFDVYVFFKYSLFIFIILQFLFFFFKAIPIKIFSCCIKKRFINKSKASKENLKYLSEDNSLNRKINVKIRECFSFFGNLEELSNLKRVENELFKDEELTYLRGMKILGIIFYIIGSVYVILYNYPLIRSTAEEREKYLKLIFCVICFRISPALLFSSSGYSLSYKLLKFLDKNLIKIGLNEMGQNTDNKDINKSSDDESLYKKLDDNISDSNRMNSKGGYSDSENSMEKGKMDIMVDTSSNKNSNNMNLFETTTKSKSYVENSMGIKYYLEDFSKKALDNIFKNQNINEMSILAKMKPSRLPNLLYFNFIFRQIHKFCIFCLSFVFIRYLIPLVFSLSTKGAPITIYFIENIMEKINMEFTNIIPFYNLINIYIDENSGKNMNDEGNNKDKEDKILITNFFSIYAGEFYFFIICSLIIFFCYKKNLCLDIILIILILIFSILKVILVCTLLTYPEKDLKGNYISSSDNPGMFFYDSDYQKLFYQPLYNFNYFLIGMIFGIVNYVLQLGLYKSNSNDKKMPLINFARVILRYCDYKTLKNKLVFLFSIIFFIGTLIAFPLCFVNFQEDFVNYPHNLNVFYKILGSIDTDLFIFIFHFFLMSCYVSGRNFIFKMFNYKLWTSINKLYYSVIIIAPIVIYIIIYKNESQINLFPSCPFIYSTISGLHIFLGAFFIFIFFELPYKKLIKLFFNVTYMISDSDDESSNRDSSKVSVSELDEKEKLNKIVDDSNDVDNSNDENNNDSNNEENENEEVKID